MGYFFHDYGCLVCGRKDRPHCANGMCQNCLAVVRYRVAQSLQRRIEERPAIEIDIREVMRQKLLALKRKKAREILSDLAPIANRPQRRSNLKSRSWRVENIEMPFGVVGIRS